MGSKPREQSSSVVSFLPNARTNQSTSERSYRAQLQKWGYTKYSTQDHPLPKRASRPSRRPKTRASVRNSIKPLPGTFSSGIPGTEFPLQQPWSLEAASSLPRDDGKTRLHLAIIASNELEVERLLFAGEPVDVKDRVENEPLHYAVADGLEKVVKLLIRFGSDVNAKGQLGRSALHLSVSHPAITQLLLKYGADVNARDNTGNTPAHLALLEPFPGTIAEAEKTALHVMVERNANLNARNHANLTPFHSLPDQQPTDWDRVFCHYVARFINYGASTADLHPNGSAPLQLLFSRGRDSSWMKYAGMQDLVNTFLLQGADPNTLLPSGWLLAEDYIRNLQADYLLWGVSPGRRLSESMFALGKTLFAVAQLVPSVDGDDTHRNSLLHQLSQCDPRIERDSRLKTLFGILLERGSDPWLCGPSGENAILAALEHGKIMGQFINDMLNSSFETLQNGYQDPQQTDQSLERGPIWPKWLLAARANEWTGAIASVERVSDPCVEGSAVLAKIIRKFLAEKHVELSRTRFKGEPDEQELRRKYMARILADCRARHIEVDKRHFHDLVDLCL
ncbi:hypothetical protein CMUS01_04937 [Colletotrichum musicola]|uniref:Ankyrin repeat protein n=1 Tax=Colletotrichum musicola TaxID=2175873 RepID=A0A8H6KU05_9PEZI|nr:hypothetical protein CMUS01_04937 [Colletotrichum musicola]